MHQPISAVSNLWIATWMVAIWFCQYFCIKLAVSDHLRVVVNPKEGELVARNCIIVIDFMTWSCDPIAYT